MKRKILNVLVVLMLVLSFNLMTSMPALAAATVTAASGGGAISADTASGQAWTSLGAITIAEGAGGDIAAGTFVLTIPSGFNFDTSSAPAVAVTGNGSLTANTPAAITATTITVTITKASSSSSNTLTIGGTTNLRVQPTAGTPLRSGNILMTSGTINSVTLNVTSFGTLSEVAGAASALKVQTQPVGSASAGGGTMATQPVVQVVDAYQNVVTGYAASVSAAVKAGSGSWTLGGTTGVAASSGVAEFTNLTATAIGLSDITTAAITFSSGSLTSVNSSTFTVKAATPSTAAEIVTYSLPGEVGSATINSGNTTGTIVVTVPYGTNVTGLVATFTTSAAITSIKVGGVAQVSGTTANDFTSPVTCTVIAQDGTTNKSWVVTVTVAAASSDATLSALTISAGTLTPAFASGTISYTAGVDNSVASITITPTVHESHAIVTVNGTTVTSGSPSGAISLAVGANTITVVVTAQDTITTKTYTVTVTRAGQAPVVLGSASTFAVLAGSTVTSIGTTVVTGDLGVSAGTSVTGFPPGTVHGTIHSGDAAAAQAQIDLTTAYNDAAGRTPTAAPGDTLGGRTLTAGVYPGGALDLTGTLTLTGDANAVWIFKAASTLITAASSQVNLSGGAKAANVYWVVGSSATLGAGSIFKGNILAAVSITLNTGTTVDGRALARNGAVTLDTNTITFTHVAAPTVTAILPVSGPTAGGTSVTITGTNFVSGATVTIGGTVATNVTVVSDTSITATTPTGTAGVQNVVVTNPDGQSGTLTGGFTYTVSSSISVTAPSAINFDTFAVDADNVGAATNGSVTITPGNDNPTGWTCTAVSNSGYMLNGSTPLSKKMVISKDAGSTYASAATGLTYSGTGLTGPLPLIAKQAIVSGDVTGRYTITIVFTAYISY